tara:strand:- start:98 stop:976 length:879 start_codon:yes stop_codon:yes gene_type:complete
MINLNNVFSASCSILNSDLSLDVEATIEHALKIEERGVSPAFLGSTSMSQLLELSDKKKLIKEILKQKFKSVIIGTGCNSLGETINLIRYSLDQGYKGSFLIMNPAYYSPKDLGVYNFFSNIQKKVSCKIILYNFAKLGAGYAFSPEVIKKLVNEFGTEAFVGMKDSNPGTSCWNTLKIKNFNMLVGNEINLLENLSLGGVGCISATTQICPDLVRKVFEKKEQKDFEKMCAIRKAFDSTGNLVTAVHYFLSLKDSKYEKMLPPLTPLSKEKQKHLLNELKKIEFYPERKAA